MSSSTGIADVLGTYVPQGLIALDWVATLTVLVVFLVFTYWIPKGMHKDSYDVQTVYKIPIVLAFLVHFANYLYVVYLASAVNNAPGSWVIGLLVAIMGVLIAWKVNVSFISFFLMLMMINQRDLVFLASFSVAVLVTTIAHLVIHCADIQKIINFLALCLLLGLNITIALVGMFANARDENAPRLCLSRHINMLFVSDANCELVTTSDRVVNRAWYLAIGAVCGFVYFTIIGFGKTCGNEISPRSAEELERFKKRNCCYRHFCCCCYATPRGAGYTQNLSGATKKRKNVLEEAADHVLGKLDRQTKKKPAADDDGDTNGGGGDLALFVADDDDQERSESEKEDMKALGGGQRSASPSALELAVREPDDHDDARRPVSLPAAAVESKRAMGNNNVPKLAPPPQEDTSAAVSMLA